MKKNKGAFNAAAEIPEKRLRDSKVVKSFDKSGLMDQVYGADMDPETNDDGFTPTEQERSAEQERIDALRTSAGVLAVAQTRALATLENVKGLNFGQSQLEKAAEDEYNSRGNLSLAA